VRWAASIVRIKTYLLGTTSRRMWRSHTKFEAHILMGKSLALNDTLGDIKFQLLNEDIIQ
jgi:hypothetical protein